jgi:hypothetical protein
MVMKLPYYYFKGFLNCYIGCNTIQDDGKRIYVAFKIDDLQRKEYKHSKGVTSNKERIKAIKNHKQFVEELVIGDFILYVFTPLKNFEKDLDVFKTGKYSQFSLRYKRIIKETYPNIEKIHSIINPSYADRKKLSDDLLLENVLPKGTEILSVPNEITETFSISHFIEVEV